MRKIHNLIQGTPEWHAYRADHFNASDAPAMMGASTYKTRDKLLHEIAIGIVDEVDAHTQKRFDDGLEFEATARSIAEKIIGDDLFPSTVSLDVEGLPLSASLDGWTMDETIIFEHKTLNKTLEAAFESGELPLMYRIQMEQQLMVSGAEKCLFMASKGTEETAKHVWYLPDPKLRFEIIAGWHQFDLDLQAYVLPVAEEKPTGAVVLALPGITYNTTFNGKNIELKSNLDVYKAAAEKLVEQSKKCLETDQDFADAEARIKACKTAEEKIAVIQESVVAEVGSIDKFVKELGDIAEMLRQCRLNEDKQVKARKDQIRAELIGTYQTELMAFINATNKRFEDFTKIWLPQLCLPNANFSGVIKGLKTIDSMRAKLNDEMARAKIEINQTASVIDLNLNTFSMLASGKEFLFPDLKQIVYKENEHFELILKNRLKDHEAAEQARVQAEAKRIADEQLAKERQPEIRTVQSDFEKVFSDQPSTFQDVPADCLSPTIKTQYQQGLIDGLDLALGIFIKHGAEGFTKAVEDFIESDCLPEVPKAAA